MVLFRSLLAGQSQEPKLSQAINNRRRQKQLGGQEDRGKNNLAVKETAPPPVALATAIQTMTPNQ